MNFSYWERNTWLTNIEYAIIGSGITGLNAAIHIKQQQPEAKVLILEKGLLPEGASTKNAGFACFGSLSEILDDLNNHADEDVLKLIQKRISGLRLLRHNLGDKQIGLKKYGGYELFSRKDTELFQECADRISEINDFLKPVFDEKVFCLKKNTFGFQQIHNDLIFNSFEAQLNTGKLMRALLAKAMSLNVLILNHVEVKTFEDLNNKVVLETDRFSISAKKLLVATNGFASRLGIMEVKPARAQVLITKPIKNLKIKGTFHLDKGYYYFRNIDNRILFGGARNLDFQTEETDIFGNTPLIQNKLEDLLKTTILPNTDFEIDQTWSGIMGVGTEKDPIIKAISPSCFCGVRLGGMGVAIGSLVGKELAELALES